MGLTATTQFKKPRVALRRELFFTLIILSGLTSCGVEQNKIEAKRAGALGAVTVTKIRPIEAKPSDEIKLTGENFSAARNLKARLTLDDGSIKDVPVAVTDRTNASFVMPAGVGLGLKSLSIVQGQSKEVAKLGLVANTADNQLPIFIGDASEICSDKQYIDRNGDQQTGTKNCSSGVTPPACTENGSVGCVTTETYKAADLTNLSANNLKSGVTIAGVTGNVTQSPDNCSRNGQQSCVAAGSYFAGTACSADGSNCFLPTYSVVTQPLKAISYNSIDATKMLDTLTVSGVTGTIAPRGPWNVTTTFPGAGFYSSATNTPADTSYTGTLFGTSGTAVLKPADCSANNETGCVTTSTYKAADLTNLSAGNIKSTVSIAGVTGNYPSVTSPLAGADSTNDLSNVLATRESQLRSATNFEFFMSDGTRVQAQGDSDILAANIANSVNIFGQAGGATLSPGNCSANGQQSCVAAGSYFAGTACSADGSNCFLPTYSVVTQPLKAISYNSIDSAKMLDTLTVSGVTGTIAPRGSWNVTTTFPGAGFYSAVTNTPADTSYTGTLFGTAGTAVLKPADCSANNVTGCVTTSTYKSADLTNLSAGNIKSTVSIAGVTGNYPSVTSPLAGADSTNDLSNVQATRESQLRSATNFEFFMSDGTRVQAQGDADIVAGNIANGFNIFGQAGGATLSPGNCSSNGQQSCVASGTYFAGTNCAANGSGCYLPTYALSTQPLRAIDYDNINSNAARIRTSATLGGVTGTLADCSTNGSSGCVATSTYLAGQNRSSWDMTTSFPGAGYYSGTTNAPTAGNIKSGVTIAGTAGQYPSSSFQLTGSSGSDLTTPTFNAQIKSSGTFQYFGSDGVRYTGSGDADIVDTNIKSAVDIFGTTGNVTAPNAWDLRVGVTVGSVTGKLKVNCRNRVSTSSPTLYNYDGAIGSIGQAGQTGGSVRDIWDTIDDYNNAQVGVPAGIVTAWGNNTDCYGVEATAGDDNVWKDVTTTNGTAASTCTATPANCTMQDKITGLSWSKLQASAAWNTALATCAGLTYNGQTGWRLPTQKELMEAYTHGIRSAASTNWMTEANMNNWFWSGSSVSQNTNLAWGVYLAEGFTGYGTFKYDALRVVCVR